MEYTHCVLNNDTPLAGWLEVRGLRCHGRHGAYEGEQDVARLFLVDVAVKLDIGAPARSDQLGDALDFAALAAAVRGEVGGQPRTLLERVAFDVAQTILRRFPPADAVRVRLAKPDPPGLDAAEEAVALELARR